MRIQPGCEWMQEAKPGDAVRVMRRRGLVGTETVERVTPTLLIVGGVQYNKSDGQARQDAKGFGWSPRHLEKVGAEGGKDGGRMSEPLIFDDEYTGPRFVYGCTFRPPGYAQVPAGRIIHADRPSDKYRHGTIEYPFALSDHDKDAFELEFVRKVPGWGLATLFGDGERIGTE